MENIDEKIEKKFDQIFKLKDTIPDNEHWIVGQILRSEITISKGATLEVLDLSARNKFHLLKGGEVIIKGESLKDEMTREDLNNEENPDVVDNPDDMREGIFELDMSDFDKLGDAPADDLHLEVAGNEIDNKEDEKNKKLEEIRGHLGEKEPEEMQIDHDTMREVFNSFESINKMSTRSINFIRKQIERSPELYDVYTRAKSTLYNELLKKTVDVVKGLDRKSVILEMFNIFNSDSSHEHSARLKHELLSIIKDADHLEI